MSKFLLTACAFGLFFSSALAEEKSLEQLDREGNRIWGGEGLQRLQFTRIVPSGTNQRIEFITALNPDCTSVNIRVTKQPEHGTAETLATTNFPTYPKENIRAKCNDHKVRGVQVNYKSAEKYTGNDEFDVLILFPAGTAWEVHYNMDVR